MCRIAPAKPKHLTALLARALAPIPSLMRMTMMLALKCLATFAEHVIFDLENGDGPLDAGSLFGILLV